MYNDEFPGNNHPSIANREIYRVYANSDLDEGRGNNVCIGTYLYRHMAEKMAKGKDVMGTDAKIFSITRKVVVDETGNYFLLGEEINTDQKLPDPISAKDAERIELEYVALQQQKRLQR